MIADGGRTCRGGTPTADIEGTDAPVADRSRVVAPPGPSSGPTVVGMVNDRPVDEPATSNATRARGTTPRARRVPRWLTLPTVLLALAAAVAIAWAGAHPTGNLLAGLIGLVLAGLAAIGWLWIVILAAVRRRFAWSVLVAPLLVGGAVAAVVTGAAERAAFELARPVLAQAVANGTCPSVAGVLPISTCTQLGETGTSFTVQDAGFLNQAGWAYFTDPSEAAQLAGPAEPGQDGHLALEERGGGWFRVIYVW